MDYLENYQGKIPIFLNPGALKRKSMSVETSEDKIEIPIWSLFEESEYEEKEANLNIVSGFIKITDRLYAFSNSNRKPVWDAWNIGPESKNGGVNEDAFNDDLSLLIETDSGPVVVFGCAHSNIVEILNDIAEQTGYKEFHAVIGGVHLGFASPDYIAKTERALRDAKIKILGTSNNFGLHTGFYFASLYREEFINALVENSFEF